MPRRTVGLEIAAEAIRLVRLVGGWRHSYVDAWQVRTLPPVDQAGYRSAVVQELRGLAEAGWLKADQVVVSVPGDQVTSRIISVPFQERSKISQVLAYEVESLLPFDLDEVVVSAAAIETRPTGSRVLAVILPKERLASVLELLSDAGIDPTTVEVGATGLARLARVAVPPTDDSVAMLELGQTHSTIALSRGGRLASFRTISATAGVSPSEDEHLLSELKRTIHFYELEEQSAVSALYLCGVRASEDAAGPLISQLTEQLDARLLTEMPSWLVPKESTAATVASDLLSFTQAIGLALRSPDETFNFRQAEFISPGEQNRARTRSLGVVAAVVVVLLLGGADLFLRYYLKEQDYTALKSDQRALFSQTFPEITVIVNELEQTNHAMSMLAKRAAFLGEGELSALIILDRLTSTLQSLPELRVDRMSISGPDIRFEGQVDSFEVVDRVRELLKGMVSAEQVTISDARMSADQQHVRFKATLMISQPAGNLRGSDGDRLKRSG